MKLVLSMLLLIFVQNDIYKEGRAELDAKHFDEAEAKFRQLIAAAESSSKGYEGLALLEVARKRFDNALENAKKAVELNGENAGAHYALALVQFNLKRYEDTIIHCERFMELTPAAPDAAQVKSLLRTATQLLIHGEDSLPRPPGQVL